MTCRCHAKDQQSFRAVVESEANALHFVKEKNLQAYNGITCAKVHDIQPRFNT